jgi:hypothetical protein
MANKEEMEIKMIVKQPRKLREDQVRKEFRDYFIKVKRKLKLDSSLEEVMWLHFKSAGFAQPDLFDKGTENFGYKI